SQMSKAIPAGHMVQDGNVDHSVQAVFICRPKVTSFLCTCVAEDSSVSRQAAVTVEASGSLHTAALVIAQRAVAAAVTRATGSNPGRDLGPFLQVQSDAIQLQRADAASETPLSGRRSSWRH
ncbi:hypothetical protein XENOCAPTIV_003452, partial [Xenoophorus captivus]